MKPLGFAGLRFMISGLLILPFSRPGRFSFEIIRSRSRTILLVALFQTFILYALFYLGMTIVEGALAAIVVGASPLVAALIAHLMMHDDRLTRKKVLSIAGGFLGVIIISLGRKPWSPAGLKEFFGILILLGSSISSAIGNVIVARDRRSIPPLTIGAFSLFIGGAGLFILSLFLEGLPEWNRPPLFWGTLFYLSSLSAVAFSIWFTLLKRPGVKVSELNLWKFIIPVFGALFSWLLLPQESPALLPLLGMIIVSLSVWYYFHPPGNRLLPGRKEGTAS